MFKKSIIFVLISIFLFSVSGFSQTEDIVPDEFTPKTWKKLNPDLQNVWQSAKKSGNMLAKFKCFVRIREPADMGDKDFLQSNGFNVIGGTYFTTISTGYVTAEDLPRVARLDFVNKISLIVKKAKKKKR